MQRCTGINYNRPAAVFSDTLVCNQLNFLAVEDIDGAVEVTAKIRYSHSGAPCTIEKIDKDHLKCTFQEPVRAVTPGQAVVFCQSDYIFLIRQRKF